jgi:hypothetical protein
MKGQTMKKVPSSVQADCKPDAASRAERDATHNMMHGRGDPDRAFDRMRSAQAANTTVHKSYSGQKEPPMRRK